jgi:MFS family permease
MAEEALSAGEKRRGRRDYQVFQLFNVVSFTMLSGSVLTLFALKLGASNLFIGLMSSIVYIAFLFMIVGRFTIQRVGTKRQFWLSWLLRNLAMLPIVAAPVAASRGNHWLTMLLILLPFLGFHTFKGIGLVAVNPTLGAISDGKDRGAFLSRLQMNVHAILIATNLVIAFYIGAEAEVARYVVLICVGIAAGIVSTLYIARLPEPPVEPSKKTLGLFSDIGDSLRRSDFKQFIVLAFIVALITGMAGPFVVVYAKQVYGIADNIVVFFLVVGNFGAISMAYLARKLIDRLGAKPLYIVFLAVLAASIIPIIISPRLSVFGTYLFFALLYFFFNFGLVGGANSGQSYFFAITSAAEHMNLGILYNVVGGVGGAIGSFVAGALLGALEPVFDSPGLPFRLMYSVVLGLTVASFPLLLRLKNDGRFSVRNALEVFLSRKDLRAVALLHKLDTTTSVSEEARVIDTLADLDSSVPVEDLLVKLDSPRFYIRNRALRALEQLPTDHRIVDAMILEVKHHAFTTAHIAARILGRKGVAAGRDVLRKSLGSDDYLLQCESMLALARLGETRSIPRIEEILEESSNPLVQIYAAAALELFGSVSSIPVLFSALGQPDPPPYLRDEIILSIAAISGMGDWFYSLYSEFLEGSRHGMAVLSDSLRDCRAARRIDERIERFLSLVLSDRLQFGVEVASWFDEIPSEVGERAGVSVAAEFARAARDAGLLRFDRLAFLLAAAAVHFACGATGAARR